MPASFITNALIAEFVGVKIFALEDTLGIAPLDWHLFGQSGSLSFTAGVMLWPVVFIMTDVINEHFGVRGVRLISWLAVGFIIYAFLFAYLSIGLVPAGWWVTVGAERGVPDVQAAFANIFGQGLWTIGGSVTAFLVGQLVDVALLHRIREMTGEKLVWLRATGSTAVSQLIDSFIVLYIAFVLGPQHWPIPLFLAVGTVNYCYKMAMAVVLIPLLYLGRRLIRAYLEAPAGRPLMPRPRTPEVTVDLVIELEDQPGPASRAGAARPSAARPRPAGRLRGHRRDGRACGLSGGARGNRARGEAWRAAGRFFRPGARSARPYRGDRIHRDGARRTRGGRRRRRRHPHHRSGIRAGACFRPWPHSRRLPRAAPGRGRLK